MRCTFSLEKEKVRLIQFLSESSFRSPESGLYSDWSKINRLRVLGADQKKSGLWERDCDSPRNLGCGDLKDLTRFLQSLSPLTSLVSFREALLTRCSSLNIIPVQNPSRWPKFDQMLTDVTRIMICNSATNRSEDPRALATSIEEPEVRDLRTSCLGSGQSPCSWC